MQTFRAYMHLGRVVLGLGGDVLFFLGTAVCSRTALVVENLSLRKQLAWYQRRPAKPRHASPIP